MSDERLRMIAEMENQVSGPVKKMQRDIESFTKSGKDLQTAFRKFGIEMSNNERVQRKHAKETAPLMRRELDALKDTIRKLNPEFSEMSSQVGEFGKGAGTAIGAAVALGAVLYETGKKASEFAREMKELKFASRESGFSPAQMRQLQLGAEEFGISAEKMTDSMMGFADAMTRIHQQDAGFISSIRPAARYTQELMRLGFAGASAADELQAMFAAMDRIKKEHPGVAGQQLARNFAAMFNIDPALSRLSGPEFQKLMQELKEFGPDPTKLQSAIAKANEFNTELTKTGAIIDGWKVSMENSLLGPLTSALHLMNGLFKGDWMKSPATSPFPGGAGGTMPPGSSTSRTLQDLKELNARPRPYVPFMLKKFATGGVVTGPTNALIGEAGPEAVVPLTGSGFDPFTLMQLMIEQMFGDSNKRASAKAVLSAFSGGGGGGGGGLSFGGGSGGGGGGRRGGGLIPSDSELDAKDKAWMGRRTVDSGKGGKRRALAKHLRIDRGIRQPENVGGNVTAGSGNLASIRAPMMRELNLNPALKNFAVDAMRHEGGVQSNLEQLFNYAAMRHMTVRQALFSGQYGPVKRGLISSNRGMSKADVAALERVGAGSNITGYATDQGMAGDPNFAKYMANRDYYNMHKVEGAWFSAHGEQGRKWAMQQRKADQDAAAAELLARANPHGTTGAHIDNMRKRSGRSITFGSMGQSKSPFESAAADRAVLGTGGTTHTVTGAADLNVKIQAPAGTSVDTSASGIFQKTNIQRNVQMAPAQSGPPQSSPFPGY